MEIEKEDIVNIILITIGVMQYLETRKARKEEEKKKEQKKKPNRQKRRRKQK